MVFLLFITLGFSFSSRARLIEEDKTVLIIDHILPARGSSSHQILRQPSWISRVVIDWNQEPVLEGPIRQKGGDTSPEIWGQEGRACNKHILAYRTVRSCSCT